MTVERCTGPGTGTWTSDRYAVTVNGSSNYVVQWNTVLKTAISIEGAVDDPMKKCFTKWGADETVTVVVDLIEGGGAPITSYELLPDFDDVTATIVSGNLQLSVPAGRKFRLHVNGDRLKPLFVTAGPLQSAIPSGSVSFPDYVIANGMPTVIPDGTKIHFPAGEHTIPQAAEVGLVVGDNCVLHVDRNAIVDARFWLGLADNSTFQGAGYVHNKTANPEDVWDQIIAGTITYEQLQLRSLFTSVGGSFNATNTVKELTLFACAYHFCSGGVQHIQDTTWVAYSRGGIGNGPSTRPGGAALTGSVVRSFIDAADDAVFATAVEGNVTIGGSAADGNTIGTSINSAIHAGYWAYAANADELKVTPGPVVSHNHIYHLGLGDNGTDVGYPSLGDNTVVACRVDTTDEEAATGEGHYNLTMDANRVYGPVRCRPYFLRNEKYPYDETQQFDAAGNIANFDFGDWTFDEVPAQQSYIVGRDVDNTPHDISFGTVTFGGTTLTRENSGTYFVTNEFPYNVFIDGVNLMALTVEDGTGLSDADTYASTAYAGTYLTARGMNTAWDAATTNTKEVALRRATAWLDEVFAERWKGVKMVSTQALEWPRSFAYDQDGAAIEGIVDELKKATVEIAYRVVVDSTVLDSDEAAASNVAASSVTVGPISVSDTFSGAATTAKKFPVVNRLLTLGGLIESGGWAAR